MKNVFQIAQGSLASQNKEELFLLLCLLENLIPKHSTVLEIGVHMGHSLQTWNKLLKPDLLIGVDNNLNSIVFKSANLVLIESDSKKAIDAVKEVLGERQIDFLFIDGDHLLDAVYSDWYLYEPLVKVGGVIAFHDTFLRNHEMVESYKVFDGLKEKHTYVECHSQTHGGTGWGLIIKK